MRKFFALCLAGVAMFGLQAVNAGDLKSGLQVDEYPPAFYVTDVTGPAAGTKLCYRCQYGARPVVSLFVRNMDENTTKLVKELDAVVGKNKEKKMAAFVTVLSNDPDAQEKALKKIADDNKIAFSPLTVFENTSGPSNYKLATEAAITICMWVDSNVKVNYAIKANELNAELIAKIVKDTEKILN
ncbi:MAG: hypothetical protein ACK6D0_14670 [Planctomyces sp.]|jgi:hypothetical protein